MTAMENILKAEDWLRRHLDFEGVELALVLGSGLSAFAEHLENPVSVSFGDIPGFKTSSVEGHGNKLIVGSVGGRRIVVMQGRIHHYEGNTMAEVTLPIRVFSRLGINRLILTNAAGGLVGKPGQLMLIEDHLDLFCPNPLMGQNLEEFGTRFPDMSEVYSRDFRKAAKAVAEAKGIQVTEGTYCYLTGPSYETPFDIRVLKNLGVSAVGMSTVPEAIVACHCGIKVLGISCITNLAAGISSNPLSHQEVMETTSRVAGDFVSLLEGLVKES